MYCQWLKHNDRNSQNILNEIDCCTCGALFEFLHQTFKEHDNYKNETRLFISTTIGGSMLHNIFVTRKENELLRTARAA
jgi:hypothetical protein